jgi:hypothetical protein
MEATADQYLEFFGSVPVAEEGTVEWGKAYIARFWELSKEHRGLYTRAQAARVLKVSPQAIMDLAKRGKIRVIELDHGIFYSGVDIEGRLGGVKGKPGRPRLGDALDLQK